MYASCGLNTDQYKTPRYAFGNGRYSLVVEGKKNPNPEKNGRELNLVSTDAEFPIDQHIQNPLKSSIGKKNYGIFYLNKISLNASANYLSA